MLLVILLPYFLSIWLVNSRTSQEMEADVALLSPLRPLRYEDRYLVFWRPQKVGSSTLLSLFISYSFRYNVFPRSKAGRNLFCVKILRCADHNYQLLKKSGKIFQNLSQVFISKALQANVQSTRVPHDQQPFLREAISEKLPYQFSLNHELCNFDPSTIYHSLPCAFHMRENKPDSYIQSSIDNLSRIREVFIVSDPLSRMISIYYFWGEL